MRFLGLDLGTKSCGLAISDKTNVLSTPMEPIFYDHEDYDYLFNEISKVVKENNISDIVLGLPKNMDGTLGFAAERSLNFANKLKELKITVHLIDERLSTVEAMNILHFTGKTEKNSKKIIDSVSANIILDTFLRGSKHEKVKDTD
jgi:putative Holliday junction resolvase